MKVALFTNTYPPSVNGVANCTHMYRRGLTELSHEVYVFAPEPAGEDPFEDDERVVRYPAVKVPGEVDYTLALPMPFAMRTFGMLARLEVDVVHTQHPLWVGRWGQSYAARRDFPVVSTAHTHYELFADRMLVPEGWVAPLVTRQVTRYYNRCQVITTPVGWMIDRLREDGVTSAMEIVPNPVDLSGLSGPDREGTRGRLGIDEGEVVVGYLGRLSDEKNLEMVIEAAALLSRERPRVRLLIVGDGPVTQDLRRAADEHGISDRAIFTGSVPHAKVADYHAAMDLFLTASGSETQPLAYTEAMYVGTPVIALATPGARDMIDHEASGLLVEPDEGARGLAAQAERVLCDDALRATVVAGGRRFAERCDYSSVADRLVEVYEQAARLFAARATSRRTP
jgi:glycosyltransferase involved in cell wall biosynthesis